MKKILSLIVSLAFVLGCFSFVVGCGENENDEQTVAEVKLVELSAAVASDETGAKSAAGEFTSGVKLADGEETATAEPQRTTIFKSQNEITFDIKLDNPKNYYIMDFKLNCAEENIEYYDSVMEEWTAIADCWIRWNGSNNQRARYKIRFNDPAVVIDKISVSDMYYSDRTDGTNKTAVNMNDRETYAVYKVDENLVSVETVTNGFEEYVFNVKKADGVVVKSVKCDDTALTLVADGTYKTAKSGKINVEYEVPLDEIFTYQSNYEREIELIHVNYNDHTYGNIGVNASPITFNLLLPLVGTDAAKYVDVGTQSAIVSDAYMFGEPRGVFIEMNYPLVSGRMEAKQKINEWINTETIKIGQQEYNLASFIETYFNDKQFVKFSWNGYNMQTGQYIEEVYVIEDYETTGVTMYKTWISDFDFTKCFRIIDSKGNLVRVDPSCIDTSAIKSVAGTYKVRCTYNGKSAEVDAHATDEHEYVIMCRYDVLYITESELQDHNFVDDFYTCLDGRYFGATEESIDASELNGTLEVGKEYHVTYTQEINGNIQTKTLPVIITSGFGVVVNSINASANRNSSYKYDITDLFIIRKDGKDVRVFDYMCSGVVDYSTPGVYYVTMTYEGKEYKTSITVLPWIAF